ncbi:LOW QUALITY PROTEIN: interferon-induced very large GTPase 1-like [Boleophthalmus pectinirostris]|uniref:LOW QUALITY PROTEIN: interferon-induced very large GTPase 1-like n=1 Tax=Boleophthalmus pectinirostris TaxID=150288 RepID=UPI0024303CFD|nr:LOW QUALITY PROTEIN: interferon-induced very large GTPase 1-like [Boleophthalmus pectinirostris]
MAQNCCDPLEAKDEEFFDATDTFQMDQLTMTDSDTATVVMESEDSSDTFNLEYEPGITSYNVTSDSVALIWDPPPVEVLYTITCYKGEELVQELQTDASTLTIGDLDPGEEYSFCVSAQIINRQFKKSPAATVKTNTCLESLLEDLGLEQQYKDKLTLSTILQIDEKSITETPAGSVRNTAWNILKKLMMVNVTARNVKGQVSHSCDEALEEAEFNIDALLAGPTSGAMLNPLDIITALFLCSDGFVQQELALKMSMCQFAVPLLLPNPDTKQCTMMLWALRDIVKKYRPQSLLESKGFIEEHIVHSKIPMVSFVRLGECSLSKSEVLNKILSNSQQYHDTFVHHNMEGGDCPRKISDGIVEIAWYLPCGNKNIDIFSEPVTVANLRGDISSSIPQFSFLCETSCAVFVFCDKLDVACSLLTSQMSRADMFLVSNSQSKNFDRGYLSRVATDLNLTNNNIMIKTQSINDADFVTRLQGKIRSVVEKAKSKMPIERMADVVREFGIKVDEDCPECQKAKQNADAITSEIHDTLEYKETQLPLQGQIWKELTSLEKEECRLRNAGSENIDNYKTLLQNQKYILRKKQNSYDMSTPMSCFINAISSSGIERCFFLKWMRLNLDNLSRQKLSGLREKYKEKSKESKNREVIQDLDHQLSGSSLGVEHFFREMGQIYEASVSLPADHPSRLQLQHLTRLCAELLLEGLPLELVDGDASNIPLRWVSDVLSELHQLVSHQSKILVITVLGVQSTGKSTLLNTMFGVQFAVSSGRCTRGAFMLLIRVSEEVKERLNCDFLMIIDTEGLKSPELAKLDNSYEHDNELATLVVGLSDITLINIAMENSTEMKDILQIVVHAFLRMKEVGKKSKCLFVHQNVSDISAHEKNLRDRKLLLEQLDEMTQAAAKMEKKDKNKCFTDVMEYSTETGNWYIPGLWNGTPPMAPVNAGYSEAVYELKKNIIQILSKSESSANDILEFQEWIRSLWTAVKYENFIFSFRNSLVADAYMRLCTEYNKWEWNFRKDMYTWVTNAQTIISNYGKVAVENDTGNIGKLLSDLKSDACTELSKGETKLLQNLTQYFKQTDGHVNLVERYKEEFMTGAKVTRRELEKSIINQLIATVDIRQGMRELEKIKENHTQEMEERVLELIQRCRNNKANMTDTELDREFDNMWAVSVEKLARFRPETIDVQSRVFHCLRADVSPKGSYASELLNKTSLYEYGDQPFVYNPKKLFERLKRIFSDDHVKAVQRLADSIIDACQQSVNTQKQRKTNYHDNYIVEILHMIDEKLQQNEQLKLDKEFDVLLKMHICARAAKDFEKMHENFLQENDPYRCLQENKEKFRTDFKDVFHERDQCQKKAEEFTDQFLRPAVEDFVNRSLGPDIIGEMLTCQQFSTRMFFQYSVLLDLISENQFKLIWAYIEHYEAYVKEWIYNQIISHFSSQASASEFENLHLQACINRINAAVKKAKTEKNKSLKCFVGEICAELSDKLVISQDALGTFMILNTADHEQFAHYLLNCVKQMEKDCQQKFKNTDIVLKLEKCSVNVQHELFVRVIGCGKQCPFCKAPCEAGGAAHTEHWTSLHQSLGLGTWRSEVSQKLVSDICTSRVNSDHRFKQYDDNGQKYYHPYKRYQEIFPDWKIPPDDSLEASDYWKYVMANFNEDFANVYHAKPADIPQAWKNITKDQAEKSLQQAFNMK